MLASIVGAVIAVLVTAAVLRRRKRRAQRAARRREITDESTLATTTDEPPSLSISAERTTAELLEKPEPRVSHFLNTGSYRIIEPAAGAAALKQETLSHLEQTEVASDLASLDAFLVDVRDLLGADEAVFWRWSANRQRLSPTAWSTPGTRRPQHFDMNAWGPLVRWAAEEQQLTFDADARVAVIRLAAAPVKLDERLIGVLSIARAEGLDRGRETIRSWLPRHATQVARLISMFELRREYSRHMRHSQALLAAAGKLQGSHKSQESLLSAICDTALEVSSATDAAVIRWRQDDEHGWVHFLTGGFKTAQRPPFAISADALAAQACADGMPLRIEDTTKLTMPMSLFTSRDGAWPIGALAIVPLELDQRVIGAIVVAADRPNSLTREEGQNVELLGQLAATSLEMVWEIEEVNKRARTDALTGLPNRGAFDDSLEYLLKQADRNGRQLSLIMADVDHFKKVNDTWGHDAGDAVLKWIAKTIVATKRAVDIAARFGGEEIAVLLPETDLSGAREVAERMRKAVESLPVHVAGEEIPITISLGVACYPEGVITKEALFAAADRALYDAKSAGRNCVRVATPKPTGVAS